MATATSVACKLCGRACGNGDRAADYPYCQGCHYGGLGIEDQLADLFEHLRSERLMVSVDNAGGGIFYLRVEGPFEGAWLWLGCGTDPDEPDPDSIDDNPWEPWNWVTGCAYLPHPEGLNRWLTLKPQLIDPDENVATAIRRLLHEAQTTPTDEWCES
ncbi:MAG: hypothetical protein AAFZ07_19490 [Actinomycetota bacterium]